MDGSNSTKVSRKPISFKNRGASPLGPINHRRSPRDRAVLQSLAREFHEEVIKALLPLGLSRDDQQDAFEAALKGATNKKPSKVVLERAFGISDMLSAWRRDKRFVDTSGEPRVLAITGPGHTLQTLAKKFVPNMPLDEVITAITRHGEVQIHQGHKVALVGSVTIIVPKSAEMTLAAMVSRFRRVAGTMLFNASLAEGRKGQGLFERQVTGILSKREFKKYSQALRPQLQDVCDRAEGGLQLKASGGRGRKAKSCGMGIFVFFEE